MWHRDVLEPCQLSMMELIFELKGKRRTYFCKKSQSYMFERVLNAALQLYLFHTL